MSKQAKYDYLIIGGGAFGLSTAYHLKQKDPSLKIKLLDRQQLPVQDAASTDINKIVRMDYGADEDDIYSKLAESSIEVWKQWNQEYKRNIYTEAGCLILTEEECNGASFETQTVKKLTSMGYEMNWLDKGATKQLPNRVPSSVTNSKGHNWLSGWGNTQLKVSDGYFNRFGGWVNASLGMDVLRQKCLDLGVEFVTGKAGEFGQFIEKKGAVIGVKAATGEEHYADLVVVCCGAWTPLLVPELDGLVEATGHTIIKFRIPEEVRHKYESENFPVWWFDVERLGYYGFPVTDEGVMKVSNHSKGFTNPTRLPDGRVISVPKTDSQLIPKVAWDHYEKFLGKAFPQMETEGWKIEAFRMCWYSDSWDNHFYFDYVPNRPGLFVATGDSGHGLKFAPMIGKVVVDCLERKDNKYYRQFKWRSKPQDFKLYIDRCEVDYSDKPLSELEWTNGRKTLVSKI